MLTDSLKNKVALVTNPLNVLPGPISTNSSAPSASSRSMVCCQRTEEDT